MLITTSMKNKTIKLNTIHKFKYFLKIKRKCFSSPCFSTNAEQNVPITEQARADDRWRVERPLLFLTRQIAPSDRKNVQKNASLQVKYTFLRI